MSTPADVRRLTTESRARVAAAVVLVEQHRLITAHSRACLDASRRLLARQLLRV